MDSRNEVREFLISRRAKITPEQAGLPTYGGNRRVPGLRREEVALLAGVSIDYYTRLERGNLNGVSDSVLDALTYALQLDEAERAHLFDLAHAANTTTRVRRSPAQQQQQRVRPSVQRILDAITDAPAYVRNGRSRPKPLCRRCRRRTGPYLVRSPGPSPECPLNLSKCRVLFDKRGAPC